MVSTIQGLIFALALTNLSAEELDRIIAQADLDEPNENRQPSSL
jgi:hypothetical protein